MALSSEATANVTTRSEIPFWELPSLSSRYVSDGTSETFRLACYWRQKNKFILDLLGTAYIEGTAGTSGAKLRRHLPERNPGVDPTSDFFDMWCTDVALVGTAGWPGRGEKGEIVFHDSSIGSTGTRAENSEGLAIFDCVFTPTLYTVLSDDEADAHDEGEMARWTILTREPSAENLPWSSFQANLQWEDAANVPIPENAPILYSNPIYNLQWLAIPEDAYRADTIEGYQDAGEFVQGIVGSVNETEFLGKAPGTLLALAPNINKYLAADTTVRLDVTFHYSFRPAGWNYFLRGLEWKQVVRIADPSTGLFLAKEFADAFDVSKP